MIVLLGIMIQEHYKRDCFMNETQPITGVCCQWRCGASYDSDVHIETFLLREKFRGEIATEQQPPNRYQQPKETTANYENTDTDNYVFCFYI
jgi:hypothetical protein